MDPSRFTNWFAIRDFVPTVHKDTYPYISPVKADLSGKSVFITGASKGIGRAIALSFARAGCSHIAVATRSDLPDLERDILAAAAAAGRSKPLVLTFSMDVSSEAAVDAAAVEISKSFGGALDVLVNNAGRCETIGPVEASRVDDFWASWEVNIKGVYLCTRALLPLLRRSATRTVINTSSAAAHMLFEGVLGYQTSKFALCRLTEFLAKEHEADGLIAIAAHPGDVLTDLTSRTPDKWKGFFDQTPEMAGDTYVWLARECRDWLSGRFISTAWDMEELVVRKVDILKGDLLKFRLTV
ncbi:hypothetical protein F5X99DRAFT_29631 [Biscogniauxia marginata]|nr:hypothetical protein F5X99DRAFT_29631 [Biscogniauxia marginata]